MIEVTNEDIVQIEQELGLHFDAPRRIALQTYIDVQACPGSGKTTMVGAKLLIISKKWTNNYQGVCVLTHTNVAKGEIVNRLKKSKYGIKLLSYPHFIGTIQEFVNKFLAIPYLRSADFPISHIDDEMCCNKGWNLLSIGARSYLERKRESLQNLQYQWINSELKLNVPGFPNGSNSASYKQLVAIKSQLMNEGYFYYNEMYSIAQCYIESNAGIVESIRHRFPIVFIDEMQDTQKFQDELLNDIFLHQNVKYQRFGDPDQAIYSGNEEANQTYNLATLSKIENSHRFDVSIARLAKSMSYNRIDLTSANVHQEQHLNTIFLVDENSRNRTFQVFAELCSQSVPVDCKLSIKTIGAIGARKDEGLTICHYHEAYDKNKSSNSFKPSKLIQYFHQAKRMKTNHEAYRLVLEGLSRCGHIANVKITYIDGTIVPFSITSLRKHLNESEAIIDFNLKVSQLLQTELIEAIWSETIQALLNFVSLNNLDLIRDYIDFEAGNIQQVEQIQGSNIITLFVGGRTISNEVTTIHSVKGETHAATLVLETKFHEFDVGQLVDYILGENNVKPRAMRKSKFMKQLYVAFSRPKYLLCLAIDKSRFPQEHNDSSTVGGWNICDLTD